MAYPTVPTTLTSIPLNFALIKQETMKLDPLPVVNLAVKVPFDDPCLVCETTDSVEAHPVTRIRKGGPSQSSPFPPDQESDPRLFVENATVRFTMVIITVGLSPKELGKTSNLEC